MNFIKTWLVQEDNKTGDMIIMEFIFATVAIFYWRTSSSYRLIVKLQI